MSLKRKGKAMKFARKRLTVLKRSQKFTRVPVRGSLCQNTTLRMKKMKGSARTMKLNGMSMRRKLREIKRKEGRGKLSGKKCVSQL